MAKIEKCPFCGGVCINSQRLDQWRVICVRRCGYMSPLKDTTDEAIAAHNHVASLAALLYDANSNLDEALQQLEQAQRELAEAREIVDKLHPRVIKLAMREDEPFIVIGPREPYFMDVYHAIKDHERELGNWTGECETALDKAFDIFSLINQGGLNILEQRQCPECIGSIPAKSLTCTRCNAIRPAKELADAIKVSTREAAEAAIAESTDEQKGAE